jgi:hypothetical protein
LPEISTVAVDLLEKMPMRIPPGVAPMGLLLLAIVLPVSVA